MNFTLVELETALIEEQNEKLREFCFDAFANKMFFGAVDTKEFIDLCKELYESQQE